MGGRSFFLEAGSDVSNAPSLRTVPDENAKAVLGPRMKSVVRRGAGGARRLNGQGYRPRMSADVVSSRLGVDLRGPHVPRGSVLTLGGAHRMESCEERQFRRGGSVLALLARRDRLRPESELPGGPVNRAVQTERSMERFAQTTCLQLYWGSQVHEHYCVCRFSQTACAVAETAVTTSFMLHA